MLFTSQHEDDGAVLFLVVRNDGVFVRSGVCVRGHGTSRRPGLPSGKENANAPRVLAGTGGPAGSALACCPAGDRPHWASVCKEAVTVVSFLSLSIFSFPFLFLFLF